MSLYTVDKLMSEARRLAVEYRTATGKPLPGVSGELANYDAARLLNLEIVKDQPGGYDAIGKGAREGKRVQIKGRTIFDDKKSGQRVGQLKLDQVWDTVVLVLMDEHFEPSEIYEASREDILDSLEDPGASKRSKRGAMSVARFKAIAHLAWCREEGAVDDEIWDNQGGS